MTAIEAVQRNLFIDAIADAALAYRFLGRIPPSPDVAEKEMADSADRLGAVTYLVPPVMTMCGWLAELSVDLQVDGQDVPDAFRSEYRRRTEATLMSSVISILAALMDLGAIHHGHG